MDYVSVEGNIGAGKSSVMAQLAAEPAAARCVLTEPLEEWQALLPAFYREPHKHGLSLQLRILRARADQLTRAAAVLSTERPEKEKRRRSSCPDAAIVERCVDAGSHVFVPCMHRSGFLDAEQVRLYRQAQAAQAAQAPQARGGAAHRLVGVIYLDADPHTCFSRVRKRNRDGEAPVSVTYLQELHDAYEDWLTKLRALNIPVVRVNCGADAPLSDVGDHARRAAHRLLVELRDSRRAASATT